MTEKWGEIYGKWNLVRARGRSVDGVNGSFSIDDGDGSENVTIKPIRVFSNFLAFIPNCWKFQMQANVPELVSWGPYSTLESERKIRIRLFTSSIKREIRHFHVVVVQWRQGNVQKSMNLMHVQSYFLPNKPFALRRSRCRCRPRC